MSIRTIGLLPIVSATIEIQGKEILFENALLDTGSGGTVFPTDVLFENGINLPESTTLVTLRGIGGGSERVLQFPADQLTAEGITLEDFVVQAGNTDYGFGFDVIIGFDFLQLSEAVVDFGRMEIRKP